VTDAVSRQVSKSVSLSVGQSAMKPRVPNTLVSKKFVLRLIHFLSFIQSIHASELVSKRVSGWVSERASD